MPSRSKWQSLPTEQINPATLAIDKLPAADIVEGMLNEDRKMLAAVQREKDRIAVGVEIITQAIKKNGRIIFIGAGTSGRLRPGERDVIVGVSASGMTQFVRGALSEARRAGSKVIVVACDPSTELQT